MPYIATIGKQYNAYTMFDFTESLMPRPSARAGFAAPGRCRLMLHAKWLRHKRGMGLTLRAYPMLMARLNSQKMAASGPFQARNRSFPAPRDASGDN